ncbi:MAG TPA: hypothetical protein DEA08_14520 [Planctomycetes bacterium]|nr:hypothetical protein [Planctomycetota bacterium]
MKRTWPALLLLSALTLGCPQPSQPSGKGGEQPAASTPADAGDAGEGAGSEAPAWKVIPAELTEDEHFYPILRATAEWPDPTSLRPLSKVPEDKQPKEVRQRVLREIVELVVNDELRPQDSKAALGLDGKDRLFMQLGKGTSTASASTETKDPKNPMPVFAMSFKQKAKGPHTIETLRERVARVVSPDLAAELKKEGSRLEPSPRVKGEASAAGMALLDRSGKFGMQFPYLYAYGDDEHLLILLQEVPHMKADMQPGGAGPPSGGGK